MSALIEPAWHFTDFRSSFAAIGVAAVLAWPYANTLRTATMIQCLGSAGLATYFAVGGAKTAAASCGIAMVQLTAATLVQDRAKLRAIYAATLILLSLCVLANWQGWPSVLVGSGTVLATCARILGSAFRMKKWFLIGSPFWLVHNIITASYFVLVIDALSIRAAAGVYWKTIVSWRYLPGQEITHLQDSVVASPALGFYRPTFPVSDAQTLWALRVRTRSH